MQRISTVCRMLFLLTGLLLLFGCSNTEYDAVLIVKNAIPYTGETSAAESETPENSVSVSESETNVETAYILNTGSKKFHLPECGSVATIKEENRQNFAGSREELISMGYTPCKRCDP